MGGRAGERTKVRGHCPTKGPGERAGLDKDIKVKERGQVKVRANAQKNEEKPRKLK